MLIGTVAIANATLLNIIERRPEIGLRRALGAKRCHIRRQVTLEAAIIGIMGSIIGTSVALIAITGVAAGRGWATTINPSTIAAAPILGLATGTIAGILPAIKASRTPPAETLRY